MTKSDIDRWAQAAAAGSPVFDDEEKRIVVNIYRLLAEGKPISEGQIAEASGVPLERVIGALLSWPLVLRDNADRVIGFWGIHVHHVEPTHTMNVDGATVYGWCAMDTLFIPEILDREVVVASTDPVDGSPIQLTVSPNGFKALDPPTAVISFRLPEEGEQITDDAIAKFCHQIYFFSSSESADKWIDDRPGLFTMSVNDAFNVGASINRRRLGSVPKRNSGAD